MEFATHTLACTRVRARVRDRVVVELVLSMGEDEGWKGEGKG